MHIEHLLTPFKLNKPVLTGSGIEGTFDSKAVDCPFPFKHNGKFYMMYVGFDGVGYQTALASSDDRINWKHEGVILKRNSHMGWDKVGMAGTWIIRDDDLFGSQEIRKINGKYWMFYHSYPGQGYEVGGAEIGLAYTEDENLLDWKFVGNPVFTYRNGDTWDGGGLYKCCVVEHDSTFYLFYNAKNHTSGSWIEQTGVATSRDMLHWERYENNPVLPVTENSWDSMFASDPWVAYDSHAHQWVMFYFGFNGRQAMNGLAVSQDLLHWEKFPVPTLPTGAVGTIDQTFAHKPGILFHDGVLYQYYCACRPYADGVPTENGSEFRCLSVATSKPLNPESKNQPSSH